MTTTTPTPLPLQKVELNMPRYKNYAYPYDDPHLNMFEECVVDFAKMADQPMSLVPSFGDVEAITKGVEFVEEECQELKNAIAEQDMVVFADSIGDLVWVLIGLAVRAGIPFSSVYELINQANREKFGRDRKPIVPLVNGKVQKPPGWIAPDESIRYLLIKACWVPPQ